MKNNICVYRHRRLDKNEIFYIGIGAKRRSREKSGRTSFWNNIVNKTKYEIEILYEDLSWEEAYELEIFLIELYGRKDKRLGTLVNLTNGGEGSPGNIRSEETRIKISNAMKGVEKSSEARRNMSIAQKKRKNNPNFKRLRKVINTDTNEVFESIVKAANSINKNRHAFYWRLNYSKNFNFKYYE